MRVLDFVDPEISNVFHDHQFINGLNGLGLNAITMGLIVSSSYIGTT